MVAIGQRVVVRRSSEGTIADRTSSKNEITSSSRISSAENAVRTDQQGQLHQTRISSKRQALLDSVAGKGDIVRDLALACRESSIDRLAPARLEKIAETLVKKAEAYITGQNPNVPILVISHPDATSKEIAGMWFDSHLQVQVALTGTNNSPTVLRVDLPRLMRRKSKGLRRPVFRDDAMQFDLRKLPENSKLLARINELTPKKAGARLEDFQARGKQLRDGVFADSNYWAVLA